MCLDVKTLMVNFLTNEVATGKVEVYNEFSLQHELGIYLRDQLKNNPDYKVQFERNTKYFFKAKGLEKHEIDITIFNSDKTKKYAIELKYPRNGAYPKTMFDFCKDIKFMEQCKQNGFTKTFCLTLVDVGFGRPDDYVDKSGKKHSGNPFYDAKTRDDTSNNSDTPDNKELYSYFRTINAQEEKKLSGTIEYNTSEQDKNTGERTLVTHTLELSGSYIIKWEDCGDCNKYYIIEALPKNS